MIGKRILIPLLLAGFYMTLNHAITAAPEVKITKVEGKDQYDITIGGKPFTAYCYDPKQFFEKPIFYPVLNPKGTPVNRQYPMVRGLEEEKGDQDHPHHQSLFFTYDEINDVKFWNTVPNPKRHIANRKVEIDGSTLKMTHEWIGNSDDKIFEEQRTVTFGGECCVGSDVLWMDHDITLKALMDIHMGDSKEGAFAIRVAKSLKENMGGKGRYINAQGLETAKQVWGKPSEWVALMGPVKGKAGDEDVTIAIYAHPSTIDFPPYWHARDYGLFSANPFAANAYDKNAPKREKHLKAGDTLHVRFRLAVYDGKIDKERLAKDYAEFAK